MHPYRPDMLADPRLRSAFEGVARAFVGAEPFIQMQVLTDASKVPERLEAGMYVTVDATLGATGDFGSGEGLYRRTSAGAWTHIG